MKNVKMKTRLIVGFCIPVLLNLINVIYGIIAMEKVAEVESALEKKYADTAAYLSIALLVVSTIIVLALATSIIRAISKSVGQLSNAAKDIALGRVNNLKLEKYANDEFGDLVDEYTKVIDNI